MRLSRSPMTATPTNLGAMINEPRTALLDQYCELVGRGGGAVSQTNVDLDDGILPEAV